MSYVQFGLFTKQQEIGCFIKFTNMNFSMFKWNVTITERNNLKTIKLKHISKKLSASYNTFLIQSFYKVQQKFLYKYTIHWNIN